MTVTHLIKREAAPALSTVQDAIELRRSQTLVSICQGEIERLILEGELERGARVNEVALAERLGTSRGPVREACRTLTQAGLLENHANRGFFVRKLAHKECIDLYDLRAGLMRLAGGLIAQRATPEQITVLRELVEAMDAARAQPDAALYLELNAQFHATLVEAADNRRLQDIYRGLVNELRLFRRRGLMSDAAMTSSNREHLAIVDAIAAHDAARAAATMENHIAQGKSRFLSATANDPDA